MGITRSPHFIAEISMGDRWWSSMPCLHFPTSHMNRGRVHCSSQLPIWQEIKCKRDMNFKKNTRIRIYMDKQGLNGALWEIQRFICITLTFNSNWPKVYPNNEWWLGLYRNMEILQVTATASAYPIWSNIPWSNYQILPIWSWNKRHSWFLIQIVCCSDVTEQRYNLSSSCV